MHYNVFAKHSTASLRSSGASKIIKSGVPLFLANRTKLPLGEHPCLPALIKKMVDFFSQKLQATSYAQREQLLKTICECVDRSMRMSDVLDLLIEDKSYAQKMLQDASKQRSFKMRMRITLAAVLGHLDLVRKWLPGLRKKKTYYECFSETFGPSACERCGIWTPRHS